MSNSFLYYGSLISYAAILEVGSSIQTFFNMSTCTFLDNFFIGESTSMVYVFNALMNITGNTFANNGYLS